ncbi:CRISPR-associated helicase Cas3' [Brachyspira catarrhinii]|uniref:CRISPR-associated helicase Cas3 n=1 Tax=Brachyspira catarrhinii TaxID=2528966 RepID=A0ABY2TTA0_9SPIR|nr:CRISPR-associated helicase Cas3' [Brachyspira catarrhinii]TKZ36104.1 CRISPR-associated helicase Cas3' [Brachyspira catarrhinii]
MIKYIAKSNKSKTHTETIEEHTNKLLKLFDDFKKIEKYSNKFKNKNDNDKELNLIETACKLHDLGKMNYKFQEYIQKDFPINKKLNDLYNELNIRDIPHGILSCCFIDVDNLQKEFGFDDKDIKVLATAIFNHHNRELLDNNKHRIEFKRLNKIVNEDLKYNVKKYNEIYNKNLYCEIDGIEENMIKNNDCKIKNHYEFWLKFIVIKGMLNKIDYAASAYVYNKDKKKYEFGINKDDFEMTADNSCEKVKTKFEKNKYRLNDCQEFMLKNNDKNIIVVASTGIGKTEGALLWAGNSKTFYTLPIKVSINAIYERIKTQEYYDKEKITLLHSDAISEIMKEDADFEDAMEKYGKSKKLSYPLTVCTIDQLFYFVFKSLGTEIFPATLKYSKIIIDEIQSYTPEITAFILYGLKVINDLGGQFCIMTATLPPIIIELMERENIQFETPKIFIKKDESGNSIKRHFIKFIEFENEEEKDFNYNEILEKAKSKKVLIICNIVKRAQEVYLKLKDIKENIEINLLHSRFIFKERKEKEDKIQKFASTNEKDRNNDAGIWISTQIVEASLDIDFDVLYTDMCSADSLLQRMGRCYRNRIYEEGKPNIFIYDTKVGVGENKNSVYNSELYDRAVKFIKKYDNDIFTEEQKLEYINKVYNTKELEKEKSKYLQRINENYEALKKLPPAFIEKSDVADLFRAIDSVTVMPEKIYLSIKDNIINEYFEIKNKEKKTKDDLKNLINKKNEILGFTTSVRLYKSHQSNTGINPIELGKNKFEKISIVDLEYDKELGLLEGNANIILSD